ncbi:MAG: glycosyltransferase family 9 protein [Rhodospirillales bacterium]|nr:glycosyltransferase family 9 protein [Rhodospirillales bacterium]
MTGAPRILVIKLGALGDFIQALGPMAAIRQHHPDAHITLLTTPPFADMARETGYFNAVESRPRLRRTDVRGWMALRRWLKAGRFTRVYDLQNSERTAIYLRLFGFHPPEWVGAARGASHRNASPERTKGHAFDGHVATLALAGIHDIAIDTLSWMKADISGFGLSSPYALLVPGCSPEHPEKRWPPEHFSTVAKDLLQRGLRPVLIGTQADREATSFIAKNTPEALDLTGKTSLAQIAGLARGAALAIGNDTGPMHLIAATGCPVLALFSGRSDPVRAKPKGERVILLRRNDLADLPPKDVIEAYNASLSGR